MNLPRILIAGDFQYDRLAASYERGFLRLGVEVARFDVVQAGRLLAWPGRNRILHRLTIRSMFLRRNWAVQFNEALLQRTLSSGVSWVLLLNGDWVMPETVRTLRKKGVRVALFHADNPFPPHYNNRPETLPVAREVDLYLIWSERLASRLRDAGVRRAEFLPFGWDDVVFPYLDGQPQGSWPGVTFIGGWDAEREAFLEELAASVPVRIHGPGYWGSRTRARSRVRKAWSGGSVVQEQAARIMRESAVSLNILRTQHVVDGEPDGTIMRHFEVPGSGGFLLSTRGGTASRLFPEGDTGAYFTGISECIEACRHFISASDERRALVARAHALVASTHTYADRAQDFLRLVE